MDLSLILVSDCWSSYFKLDKVTHALCNAHLVRELRAILENDPSQVWAQKMLDFLLELLERKKELLAKALELGLKKDPRECERNELPQLSDEEVAEILLRFLEIVKEGFEYNHIPFATQQGGTKGKRKKQSKAVNLLFRLRDHAEDWLRFITDIRVPFSNNFAELSVRTPKIHQHILHFSRTMVGLAIRLILYSINQSAQQNQISRYVAIQKMFEGITPEELFGCEVSQIVRDSAPERSDKVVLPKRKGELSAGNDNIVGVASG